MAFGAALLFSYEIHARHLSVIGNRDVWTVPILLGALSPNMTISPLPAALLHAAIGADVGNGTAPPLTARAVTALAPVLHFGSPSARRAMVVEELRRAGLTVSSLSKT